MTEDKKVIEWQPELDEKQVQTVKNLAQRALTRIEDVIAVMEQQK